jgi:hypothetical protein
MVFAFSFLACFLFSLVLGDIFMAWLMRTKHIGRWLHEFYLTLPMSREDYYQ